MSNDIRTNEWQRGPYMARIKAETEPGSLTRWLCILALLGLVAAMLIVAGDAVIR